MTTFDIAVLGVMMPGKNGLMLASGLKRLFSDLPFLFVIAKKAKEDIIDGLKLGVNDYITKPFDGDELILLINNNFKRASRMGVIEQPETAYKVGALFFRAGELRLCYGSRVQQMTEKEVKLLIYIITGCPYPAEIDSTRAMERQGLFHRLQYGCIYYRPAESSTPPLVSVSKIKFSVSLSYPFKQILKKVNFNYPPLSFCDLS